jgi:hypothetical protein
MATDSNQKFTVKSSSLAAGKIKFYDNIEPPLKAGQYTMEANQQIAGVGNDGNPLPNYVANKAIVIKGTQFSLKSTAVYSTYPAPLSLGSYGTALPNLVLTDFSLPWSRPIDPMSQAAFPDTPWLGLLTIHQDELPLISDPTIVTVNDLINPGGDIQGPILDTGSLHDDLTASITVVDIDFATFQKISPTIGDLEFLAHGREVNTGGKAMLGMDADGLFSLLVGNRLPVGGTQGDAPEDNTVLLVSYEGHTAHLRGGAAPTKTKVRLALLHTWKFRVNPATASFLSDMQGLCTPGSGGVNLMQMPGDLSLVTEPTAKKALEIGYSALQNEMRVGEKTTSWYRGPLVPAPTLRDSSMSFSTYLYSDHAIHYDPGTGIFDHSYAGAWQIGRLLALSDGSFAKSLFEWRNSYVLVALQQASQKTVNTNIKKVARVDSADTMATKSLDTGLKYTLNRALNEGDWPKVVSRGDKTLGSALPGMLSDDEKGDLLSSDEDPLLKILKK